MSDTPTPRTTEALRKAAQRLDPKLALIEMTACSNQLERELAAERKAREKAEARLGTWDDCKAQAEATDRTTHRAEQAEAKLNIAREAISDTLKENRHLADGENCTLIRLKQALAKIT